MKKISYLLIALICFGCSTTNSDESKDLTSKIKYRFENNTFPSDTMETASFSLHSDIHGDVTIVNCEVYNPKGEKIKNLELLGDPVGEEITYVSNVYGAIDFIAMFNDKNIEKIPTRSELNKYKVKFIFSYEDKTFQKTNYVTDKEPLD